MRDAPTGSLAYALGLGMIGAWLALVLGNCFGDRFTYYPMIGYFWVFLGADAESARPCRGLCARRNDTRCRAGSVAPFRAAARTTVSRALPVLMYHGLHASAEDPGRFDPVYSVAPEEFGVNSIGSSKTAIARCACVIWIGSTIR